MRPRQHLPLWTAFNISTLVWLLVLFPGFAHSQNAASSDYSFAISGSQPWTDTGVELSAGDVLTFTAEPKAASDCPSAAASPESKLPVGSAPANSLIAKTSENADPVPATSELHAAAAGHLFLGINTTGESKCVLRVKLTLTHGQTAAVSEPGVKQKLSTAAQAWLKGQFGTGAPAQNQSASAAAQGAPSGAVAVASAPGLKLPSVILDGALKKEIDRLPRRVHDAHGNAGDMINFVMIGSQDKVQAALTAADWHLADVDSKEAGLKAILNTYQKKDYVEMPMSHLYLFDRMQDFGYEQAEAFSVVATRHHFRLWKAPFTWNNENVWVGAATHDIGFEKDVRTGKLTHKIDPNVDTERQNLAEGLQKSGKSKAMTYYLPPNPVQDAKNASGGSYHSDGRLLVVFLN